MEEWAYFGKDNNYRINKKGEVESFSYNKKVKKWDTLKCTFSSTTGKNKKHLGLNYFQFRYVSENGESKASRVHRMLALKFIPNPNNLSCVDHIDGDRRNNDISNLRWVSQEENLSNPNTPRGFNGFSQKIDEIKFITALTFRISGRANKELSEAWGPIR